MHSSVRQIIAIYCLCDDFLSARGYQDAPQAKLTTAQVMTVALVGAALFNGNQERSRVFLRDHGYIAPMLSKGCFNRRLHEVPEALWQALFALLADVHKQSNESQQYAVDSMPAVVCDNYRLSFAIITVSAAAACIRKRRTAKRSGAILPASVASFTVCGCIF